MSEDNKRKGRKTINRRTHVEEEKMTARKPETLDQCFEVFIRAKEVEGLRERTLKDHRLYYSYFKRFLQDHYPNVDQMKVSSVTIDMCRHYIHYMKNEKGVWDNHQWLAEKHGHKIGLSNVTINVRIRPLKCCFRFLLQEGYVISNPWDRVRLLKTEEDTIGAFSEEQIKLLLKQPDQRTYTGFRDYVLMILFLDTGIRVNEALGLTPRDFMFEQKTFNIPASLAKNTKSRVLPMSKNTAKLMKDLIKENESFDERADRIFLTNYGEELQAHVIRSRFSEYGKKAKIKGVRVSPHTFRHTFAKYYIMNGGDPFSLQRVLGHSTMSMVRKYVQMNTSDLKLQHNQFSPIKKLLS